MKKSTLSILPTAIGLLAGSMFVYFLTLFVLFMTYRKEARTVANTDYVSEVTRWRGHTHVNNIPIVRPNNILLMKGLFICFLLFIVCLIIWSALTKE